MKKTRRPINRSGLAAALVTPLFLGMNPIFGKLAYREGADPFTVAAFRTVIAVFILWVVYYLFFRRYLFIYPAGLMNCVAIGTVNGIGSLMYYNGLHLLDASIAQLMNGMYLLFVVILTRIGGQQVGWRTLLRVMVSVLGILFITGGVQGGEVSWLGIGFMLGNALLFAGTVVMSQRALYDMPAQTVTFYVLATMAVIVTMARIAYIPFLGDEGGGIQLSAFWAILGLAITTAISRLVMFIGVKGLGSLQTTLLAVLEMATSITFAYILLGEVLVSVQWIGVTLLLSSLFLPVENLTPNMSPTQYLPHITRVRLWQLAFTRAFISDTTDKRRTTEELAVIEKMLKQDKYTTHEINVVNNLYLNDLISTISDEESELPS